MHKSSRHTYLFPLVASVLLGAAFSKIFYQYATYYWLPQSMNGVYTQAPFALVVFFWLIWRQRSHLTHCRDDEPVPWWGYSMLVLGIAMKVHGELHYYSFLRGISLVPILLGIIVILYPRKTVRALLFPVFFLIFIIPLPTFALDMVTVPLQRLSTAVPASILQALRLNTERIGYTLLVDNIAGSGVHEIVLSEGCSGIRSIVSLMAVTSLYLYLRQLTWQRSLILAGLVLPLAIAGNCLRIIVTIFLIRYANPEMGQAFFHRLSGLFLFMTTILLLFGMEKIILSWPVQRKIEHVG